MIELRSFSTSTITVANVWINFRSMSARFSVNLNKIDSSIHVDLNSKNWSKVTYNINGLIDSIKFGKL